MSNVGQTILVLVIIFLIILFFIFFPMVMKEIYDKKINTLIIKEVFLFLKNKNDEQYIWKDLKKYNELQEQLKYLIKDKRGYGNKIKKGYLNRNKTIMTQITSLIKKYYKWDKHNIHPWKKDVERTETNENINITWKMLSVPSMKWFQNWANKTIDYDAKEFLRQKPKQYLIKQILRTPKWIPKNNWNSNLQKNFGKSWISIKKEVIERANNECELCEIKLQKFWLYSAWFFETDLKTQTFFHFFALCFKCFLIQNMNLVNKLIEQKKITKKEFRFYLNKFLNPNLLQWQNYQEIIDFAFEDFKDFDVENWKPILDKSNDEIFNKYWIQKKTNVNN